MVQLHTCIQCNRAFTRQAKPSYAFNAEATLVGRVHANCESSFQRANELTYVHTDERHNPEAGRRRVWLDNNVPECSSKESLKVALLFLAVEEGRRDRHLAWWQASDNPSPSSEDEINQIVKAWKDLEARYKAQFPEALVLEEA